jgi:hypothetical protein
MSSPSHGWSVAPRSPRPPILIPGRTHYIIGQTGWTEVADYVKAWIEKQ